MKKVTNYFITIMLIIALPYVFFMQAPENYGATQIINGTSYTPWVVPFNMTKINLSILLLGCILYLRTKDNEETENEESINHS